MENGPEKREAAAAVTVEAYPCGAGRMCEVLGCKGAGFVELVFDGNRANNVVLCAECAERVRRGIADFQKRGSTRTLKCGGAGEPSEAKPAARRDRA